MRGAIVGVTAILLCFGGFSPRAAVADTQPAASLPSTADLDGFVVALGPLGSAIHRDEDGWDGTFGGEVVLVRVREQNPVSAVGLALGGLRLSRLDRGHLYAELLAGTDRLFGVTIGAATGVVLEIDAVRPPRWGFEGTVWAYAGVAPYIRVGRLETSGTFAEAGLRIPLPVFRWR